MEVKPLHRLTAETRRRRLARRGLGFLPDTEGPALNRRLIPDSYCNDSFRVARFGCSGGEFQNPGEGWIDEFFALAGFAFGAGGCN